MTTVHPDDAAHVTEIVNELHGHRTRLRLGRDEVAAAMGVRPGRVTDAAREPNPRAGTLQAYAYGVRHRLVFDLPGCPDVADAQVATLQRLAAGSTDWRRRHTFERAALGALICATRLELGLAQLEVGARIGRLHGFVSKLERGIADDPLLSNYQQVARALGGRLRMRVVALDAPTGDRLAELLAEIQTYATVVAPRHKVDTPDGPLKGISQADAHRLAAETGGTAYRSTAFLLPTRHEVLGPWQLIDAAPSGPASTTKGPDQ